MSKISDFLHPPKPSALVFYSSSAGGYVALSADTPGPFATLDEAISVAGPGAVVRRDLVWAMYREGAFEEEDQ